MDNPTSFKNIFKTNKINSSSKIPPITNCETRLLPEGLLKDINYDDDDDDEDDSDSEDHFFQIVSDKKTQSNNLIRVKNVNNFNKFHYNMNNNKNNLCATKFLNPQINTSMNSIQTIASEFHNLSLNNNYQEVFDMKSLPPQKFKPYSNNNLVDKTNLKKQSQYLGDNSVPYRPNNFYLKSPNTSQQYKNFYNGNFSNTPCLKNFRGEEHFINPMMVHSENSLPTFNAYNNCKFIFLLILDFNEKIYSPNLPPTNYFNQINVNNGNSGNNYAGMKVPARKNGSCNSLIETMRLEGKGYNFGPNNGGLNPINMNHNNNAVMINNSLKQNFNLSNPNVNVTRKNYSGNTTINNVNNITNIEEIFEEPEEDFEKFVNKIGNELIPFIKTQKGSRFMQKFLNKISPENIDKILFKLSPHFKEIMTDNYGNYFMQKLTQNCTSEQRTFVMESIFNDFLEIANNTSGTHSIQSLIEIISMPDEQYVLKKCILPHILRLSYNSNGTHIIQKIIACFEEENREYLNNYILENLCKMCMNANGICVVKKFINANKDLEVRKKLIQSFEKDCIEIVEDAFGNYAIQHVIDTYGVEACHNIINIIIQNIVSLSNQKFSSNVVEKCILTSNKEIFKSILNEIFINTTNFIMILKNKYGNFVIQKAIQRMGQKEKIELKEFLIKKVNVNGGKEKTKFNSILEIM